MEQKPGNQPRNSQDFVGSLVRPGCYLIKEFLWILCLGWQWGVCFILGVLGRPSTEQVLHVNAVEITITIGSLLTSLDVYFLSFHGMCVEMTSRQCVGGSGASVAILG